MQNAFMFDRFLILFTRILRVAQDRARAANEITHRIFLLARAHTGMIRAPGSAQVRSVLPACPDGAVDEGVSVKEAGATRHDNVPLGDSLVAALKIVRKLIDSSEEVEVVCGGCKSGVLFGDEGICLDERVAERMAATSTFALTRLERMPSVA